MAEGRFHRSSLAALDEPVQRYLAHAIGEGASLGERVRLTMAGRIRVGPWLNFTAQQEFAGHNFVWAARAGWGALKPLHVRDFYRDGTAARMDVCSGACRSSTATTRRRRGRPRGAPPRSASGCRRACCPAVE